ncbi:hypothetical protein FEDK69T_17230 [Flavobacterium enshiense DK69]|uniref:DUF4199 domain-containing protein n=1 Tax=Flavobacterium enshiense DK69 TaxID=1107311 RepID=V6SEI9_9FLAO|nr:DUF4199 domain-containing protein [Flavobacterium enshiense]ESU22820.1 hypothetical protein FEDK69T_17230 [Flavobacterium enshiense DK69]KGO93960.1 hypothetical protein Q767_13510 [Flavobacterium enshiense DK69]
MNEVIKKNGINYGIVIGFISILLTASLYAIDIKLFTNLWLGLIMIVVYIIIGIVLVSKTKKQLNGLITFKEAFTVYFIAGAIGATMAVIFNILLFNVIDPEAKETLNNEVIEYTVNMMKKAGAPTEKIKEVAEKMQNTDNYSVANQGKGLVFNFILSAIFGALLALIFRNKTSNLE